MAEPAFLRPEQKFHPDPARSYTLPARYYTDPAVLGLERTEIFFKNWLYVCHREKLAKPGDYVTTSIFEQNIALIKGKDGQVRAFYNVCSHRAHQLLAGEGTVRAKTVTCPYHAWAYHLDGRVRSARGSEKVAGFAADEFCLCQVRVEEFCNFVFVNLDPDAASLASTTGDLEAQIRRYVPDLDGLTKAAECGFELEANWKVVVENFNECYHCPGAHPALASLLDMETYKIETEGLVATHRSRTRQGANKAYDYQAGGEEALENGIFFVLWPNLMIWVMPGRSNIGLLQCNPSAPGHTVERFDLFLPDATPNGQEQAYADYFRDVLNPEDISLVENVQRGLHQMGYNQGRFMVDAECTDMSEHAVHHFQTLVHEALGEFDWRTRASRRRS